MPVPPASSDPLDALVDAVLSAPKYRALCEAVIRNVGRHELARRRNFKEAVRATKTTLHQVAGAYMTGRMRYEEWVRDLEAHAHAPEHFRAERFRACCRRILQRHVSTRERLPILPAFYPTLFATLPPIRSLLDIGCGLNPMTLPWMPCAPEVEVYAYDLYTDQAAFLNEFFRVAGLRGRAEVRDVAASPPARRADVALVLKTLPLFGHLPYGDGLALLRSLDVDYVVVSFPVKSIGGREKGMAEHYSARFLERVREEPWRITPFSFETERTFLIRKTGRAAEE